MTDPDDVELLLAVSNGDRNAGCTLVQRHHGSMRRYARSLVGQDAEDVVQQAWLDALRGRETFAGRASVRIWLLTLTRHAAFRSKRLRVGQRREHVSLEVVAISAGWGADPESAVGARLEAAYLSAALESLWPEERELFILREIEGLSGPEVASILDLSLPAMKSRLHRARLQLASAVRKEFSDGA